MSEKQIIPTKAEMLMKEAKSVKDRSAKYANRIATTLQTKMITPLEEEIEEIDDKIFDLENFSLETNLNKGQKLMTKEDCQERFEKIINLTWEQDLKRAELKSKKAAYDKLFSHGK